MIFFFSSRRRHTRLQGDWSSDVCSSDLAKHLWALSYGMRRISEGCSFVSSPQRSEEHTSELQSPCNLGCRLLLDKKLNNCGVLCLRQTTITLQRTLPVLTYV